MLANNQLIAFVPTENQSQAKKFYQETLGLKLLHQDGFACVFDAHGTTLRVATVPKRAAATYTVLGWEADDIEGQVKSMADGGIHFEVFPGLNQDASGIWTAPDGTKVAWFKDPDGNVLSLSQHKQ